MEYDYGVYEGITTDQIHETRPNWLLWDDGCPSGEMPDDVGERVDALLAQRVRPALAGGDVLLVAHSHLLRILAARWLGLAAAGGAHFVLDPAGVAQLGAEHGEPALLHWNLTG
jgi:probable phosphoglycerate mutase